MTTVIIPYHNQVVVGAYTDMNRAKRAAKEKLPHIFKRVKYIAFTLNDGVSDGKVEEEPSNV